MDPTSVEEQSQQLGQICRAKRVEMNLSLRDIENAISIRATYIQGIEEGTVHKALSTVYAQGFFKQYANFLHLDSEQLIKEYPLAFGSGSNQEFDYGIGTLEVRNSLGQSVKSLPNIVILFSILIILTAAYFLAKYLKLI